MSVRLMLLIIASIFVPIIAAEGFKGDLKKQLQVSSGFVAVLGDVDCSYAAELIEDSRIQVLI